MSSLLQNNRDAVLERLAAACSRAGRSPDEVRLLAVTKTVPAPVARDLAVLGQLDLGENRVTGLEEKSASLADVPGVRWHFIGHLQRNKARRVARLAHTIHSVDSIPLLETLARVSEEEGVHPRIYLQVNVAAEEAKHGLAPDEAATAVERARALGNLPLLGLMTMAPLVEPSSARAEAAARTFAGLGALAATLPADAFEGGTPRLSMGMSGDLEQAVAAGAHVVRIGTALYAGLDLSGSPAPPHDGDPTRATG